MREDGAGISEVVHERLLVYFTWYFSKIVTIVYYVQLITPLTYPTRLPIVTQPFASSPEGIAARDKCFGHTTIVGDAVVCVHSKCDL